MGRRREEKGKKQMKKKKLSGHFCVVAVAESCRLYRVELCLNWKQVACDFPQVETSRKLWGKSSEIDALEFGEIRKLSLFSLILKISRRACDVTDGSPSIILVELKN